MAKFHAKDSREYFLSAFKLAKLYKQKEEPKRALVWLKIAKKARGKCNSEDSEIDLEIAKCIGESGSVDS